MNFLPLLAILTPMLGALVVWRGSKRSEQAGSVYTAITCGFTFFLIGLMYPLVKGGNNLELVFKLGMPVDLCFRVDMLGEFLGLIASFLWFLASIFSIEYMRPEHAKTRFNVVLLICLSGMLGIVFTGDLFSLFLFFELMSVLSYVLVIHEENAEAMKAGLKYLYMGVVGGLSLLCAIIAVYFITGTVDFTKLAIPALTQNPNFIWVFWAFVIGFGVKAGMFPVHVWLPDAHPVAPSPASALLSGAMIKAGAFGIIRVIYSVMGHGAVNNEYTGGLLLFLAVFTMLLGSGCAIVQKEIKRMLAYSSIAQIGYVLLGVALLSPLGLTGGLLHIFNHALMKGCLFLCAGAIIYKTGLRQLDDLKGIGKRMPIIMICFTMVACSMIGFPPFAGFISKWFLALGALESARIGVFSQGIGITIVVCLLLSSLLNVVYYGPIVINAWFGSHDAEASGHGHVPAVSSGHDAASVHSAPVAHAQGHNSHEAKVEKSDPNWLMLGPILFLALAVLFFGLFPQFPLGIAKSISQSYFPKSSEQETVVSAALEAVESSAHEVPEHEVTKPSEPEAAQHGEAQPATHQAPQHGESQPAAHEAPASGHATPVPSGH